MTKEKFINNDLKPSLIIPSILAGLNSKKLAAKYPIMNIGNNAAREAIEEWAFKNNFHLQLKKTFYMSSKFAGAYWVLTKVNDEWKMIVTKNVILVSYDAADNILDATIYTRVIKGVKHNYWVYEEHKEDGIYRTISQTNIEDKIDSPKEALTSGKKVSTMETFLDTGIRFEPFISNEGNKTVFFIPNEVATDSSGDLLHVSDSATAYPDIDLLDDAWMNLKYTLRFARPRLIIQRDHGAEINDLEGDVYNDDIGDEYLSGGTIVITSSLALDGDNGGVSSFIPNPQVLDSARKEYKEAFISVLSRAGFAGGDDADTAQKSEYEVAQIRDGEFSSMEDKISLFQNEAKKFLYSIGSLLGVKVTKEDGIDIQRLDVREQMQMVDNLIKAVDAGFDDMENAVAKYRGVSKTEAQGIIDKIKKEKEERAKEAMEQQPEEVVEEEVEVVDKKVDNELTKPKEEDDE